MYVTGEQANDLIKSFSENIHIEYSEKLDFLSSLLEDDDWSFIIKAHSLIEALVTEAIVHKIDQEPLRKIIERLPLHGEVSKIAIVRIYEIFSKEQIKFLAKISEIRNNVVHKYENINFSFELYIKSLDKQGSKNWKELFAQNVADAKTNEKLKDMSIKDPVAAIWMTLLFFVNDALLKINIAKGQKALNENALETTKALLKL